MCLTLLNILLRISRLVCVPSTFKHSQWSSCFYRSWNHSNCSISKNIRRIIQFIKKVQYSCYTDMVKILDKYLWRNLILENFTACTACNSTENWNHLQVFLNAFDNVFCFCTKASRHSIWIKKLQNVVTIVIWKLPVSLFYVKQLCLSDFPRSDILKDIQYWIMIKLWL